MAEDADDEVTRQMRWELTEWWKSLVGPKINTNLVTEFSRFAGLLIGSNLYPISQVIRVVDADKVKQLWTKHLQLLMKHGDS